MQPSRDIARLLEIMSALRHPVNGCPWDIKQNFASIVPYTLEEAYEVADAVERGDFVDLKDELGDLLLQVVFHAQMAQEAGHFEFGDVVAAITAKMIRRHPHIFGSKRDLTPEQVKALWGEVKAQEKRLRRIERASAGQLTETRHSALDGVPVPMSALTRALKLQEKAGSVGFDWNDPREVLAKMREELDEIEDALNTGTQQDIAGEIGDMMFAVTNLARHLKIDPEAALRLTNAKFTRRFHFIEDELAKVGRKPEGATLEELEALWTAAKTQEKQSRENEPKRE